MDIQITPTPLSGCVTPPPSKSLAHRYLIAAGLGSGVSTLRGLSFSKDIEATLRCLEALGCTWQRLSADTVQLVGIGGKQQSFREPPFFDCGESGSTLRFFIPIALAVAGGGVFTGRGRLMERPQQPYFDLFDEKGISYQQADGQLTVRGALMPGEFRLAGNVSSQFFTGLLYAASLLDGPSAIVSTTALESADYITMTRQAMAQAGISSAVSPDGLTFAVTPGVYQPLDITVEADWSQAGFWYAAKALGNEITIAGLNPGSAQGDKVVASLYEQLITPGKVEIDLSACPDLLPPLAVMAAAHEGGTAFVNGSRLRIKESDRLATVHSLLSSLGISAEEGPDSLMVQGGAFGGGTVDGANDHRIVMATAIAATRASGPVTILGAEAVSKSYPSFWDEYKRLGGIFHVL